LNIEEVKDILKSTILIKDVLRALGIDTKSQCRNIRCFIHDDKTPSMTVYEDRVHCHACQFDEDIVGVTSKALNLSFVDSVKWLADQFMPGVQVDGQLDYELKNRITLQRNVSKGLKAWRNKAYDRLCIIFRASQEGKKLPPNTVGFFTASEIEGQLENIIDTLNYGDELDWLTVYRQLGEGWGL
jgi:hypothetical protein